MSPRAVPAQQDWCVLFWLPTCERVKSGGPRPQEIAGNRSAARARANGNGLICNSQRDKSHHHNCRPVIQPGLISNSSGLIYLWPTHCLFLKYPLIYGSVGPIHNSAVQLSLVQIELPGLQRKASGRRGKKADLMRVPAGKRCVSEAVPTQKCTRAKNGQ